MATNKKRMTNLLLMGIPPYMFYIYMILGSDARKIFNILSLLFSPLGTESQLAIRPSTYSGRAAN